jgi:hemerythrin
MDTDWKAAYCIGHPLLDEQHRTFFALCKEAEACRTDRSPEGRGKFHTLLNELVVYARRHFATEESLLARHDYPLLAEQKSEHEAYSEKLTEFVFEATFGELDRDGLFAYLSTWWTEHILDSDMKYREFLLERAG